MFEKQIEELLENCKKELLESKDKKIQKNLKFIKKEVNKDKFDEFIKDMLKEVVSTSILVGDNGKGNYEFILNVLEHHQRSLAATKKSLVIEVKVSGFEDRINRIMEVPYFMSVGDLAYYVLAAFEAEASHLFQVSYKDYYFNCNACDDMMRNKDYYFNCNACDDMMRNDGYADKVGLPDLKFRKGSKLQLWYDFGDDYWFDIKILEIKENDETFKLEDAQILEGTGYGIWEDAHYELSLFMNNKEAFDQFIESNGIEPEWFPIDEEFDLEASNEILVDRFWDILDAYQPKDEDFDA